mgnify:CR=1 FL=1
MGGSLVLAALIAGCSGSNSSSPTLKPKSDESHVDVVLLDREGQALAGGSHEPYSPRETCGKCHDIDKIANGYHFQQGRTDMDGNIVVKPDYFKDGREHLLSAGMYGKW